MRILRIGFGLSLLALAGLTGCAGFPFGASTAPQAGAPPAPDRARLVVYRPAPPHLLGRVADHAVEIDGTSACALGNDRFFTRDLPAGAASIEVGGSRLDLTTEAGRSYYVRVAFNRQRASLAGWIPAVLGFDDAAHTPQSGLFALAAVDPPAAAVELAGISPEPACR